MLLQCNPVRFLSKKFLVLLYTVTMTELMTHKTIEMEQGEKMKSVKNTFKNVEDLEVGNDKEKMVVGLELIQISP